MNEANVNEHERLRDSILMCAGVAILIAWARYAAPILEPFLLSLFITVILAMPVHLLRRSGITHRLAVLIVVGAVVLFFSAISIVVGNSIDEFYAALPTYQAELQTLLDKVNAKLSARGFDVSQHGIVAALDPGKIVGFFDNFLSGIGGVLSNVFLIILTVVFMLADSASYSKRLGNPHWRDEAGLKRMFDTVRSLGTYMEVKACVSLLTGAIIWGGLWLMDVEFAALWGLLAFLLNFIPTIGSILAAIPVLFLSLLQFDPVLLGMILALYLFANIFVGNFIEPLWMAKSLGLSTLAVFLSLVFWGWVFGPVGMFLCVPLTMVTKSLSLRNRHTLWLAVMLSSDTDDVDLDESDDNDSDKSKRNNSNRNNREDVG